MLLVGTQTPDSPAREENAEMTKHIHKISFLENKTLTYLGLSALFPVENVWDMIMICLNRFSLVLMRVLDAYSDQLTEAD